MVVWLISQFCIGLYTQILRAFIPRVVELLGVFYSNFRENDHISEFLRTGICTNTHCRPCHLPCTINRSRETKGYDCWSLYQWGIVSCTGPDNVSFRHRHHVARINSGSQGLLRVCIWHCCTYSSNCNVIPNICFYQPLGTLRIYFAHMNKLDKIQLLSMICYSLVCILMYPLVRTSVKYCCFKIKCCSCYK